MQEYRPQKLNIQNHLVSGGHLPDPVSFEQLTDIRLFGDQLEPPIRLFDVVLPPASHIRLFVVVLPHFSPLLPRLGDRPIILQLRDS